MTRKIFSVPLNPKLDLDTFENEFLPWLNQHKDYIYDVYFTCRLAPFDQDAMGDVFRRGDWRGLVNNAMVIQEALGIPLSATFNNYSVAPTTKNLQTFVESFKPLYEAGIRTVTIPHTIWMLQGLIQKEFPELKVKNTILRNVQRPNELVKLAEAGFYYVNLDRDLMRDQKRLIEIKRAKDYIRKNICEDFTVSLLANEGCWGNCPVQDEHFEFNFTRQNFEDPTFFSDPISKPTCPRWDSIDPAGPLKVANFPPWKKDWDEFIDTLGIDVIKMHGREHEPRLRETMKIISKYANGEEILFDDFNNYIQDANLENKPITVWREKIKTCQFNCWDCHYCEDVVANKQKNKWVTKINQSLVDAQDHKSNVTSKSLNIKGLTSEKIKHFLNNLCQLDDVRLLEIGSYRGSTFCSAIENNQVKAVSIDNWSTPTINPARNVEGWTGTDDPLTEFKQNIQSVLGKNQVMGFNEDVNNIDLVKMPFKFNVVFYDGDHTYDSTHNFLNKFSSVFEETFVLIMDDWNWEQIKTATEDWAKEYTTTIYKKEIQTKGEDPDDFWNGLGIFVLRKNREHIT